MKTSGRSLVWAAAFIVAAELAIPRLVGVDLSAQVRHHRNPYNGRAWDEYLSATIAQRGPGPNLLVLSNSQAVGNEVAEGKIYPSVLEERLNAVSGETRIQVT